MHPHPRAAEVDVVEVQDPSDVVVRAPQAEQSCPVGVSNPRPHVHHCEDPQLTGR